MTAAKSVISVLEMLPDARLDDFLKRLTPEAVEAIKKLDKGAQKVPDAVAREIAATVFVCLEAN